MEQVHLAAQLAVVALLGLFQGRHIGLQILVAGPSRAVNPRQHRVLRITPPIGPGDLHQLEGVANLARRGHVRAAAQVYPAALVIELDVLIARNGIDQFNLEILALGAEKCLGLVARLH